MIVPGRTFGVEYECFWVGKGVSLETILTPILKKYKNSYHPRDYHHSGGEYWDFKYDSTIKGGDWQCEIASPILSDEKGMGILGDFHEELKKSGAQINETTGFHVHHYARDLDKSALMRLFYTYCIMEELLFNTFCTGRSGNFYCRSSQFQPSEDIIEKLMGREKYWALNFRPLGHIGTVEFRALGGTMDFNLIKMWIILTQRLIFIAKKKPFFPDFENFEDLFYSYLELGKDEIEKSIIEFLLKEHIKCAV